MDAKDGGLKILELGTGWYPIIPIAFYLSGLGQTTSIDIQDWLIKERFIIAIKKMKAWREAGRLDDLLPDIDEKRWDSLLAKAEQKDADLQSLCHHIGLKPLLVDARSTALAAESFDFICSNNTFEHIYSAVLSEILIEFKRLLKPDGLMSHFIDMSDHFAHFDTSINIYNFLKFSKKRWALIDNSIQPQNRLRWKDFIQLYESLDIPVSEEDIRPGNLELLAQVTIHEEFSKYSPEELAISHGYIVSRFQA